MRKLWRYIVEWIRLRVFQQRDEIPIVPVRDPEQASRSELNKGWSRLKHALWKYRRGPIRTTANYCLICGRALRRAPGQIVYYCSRECRHMRHNKAKHA